MDRLAADVRRRGRAVAALVAVFAVLAMHGLNCMAGDSHTAGTPVMAASPPHAEVAGKAGSPSCPDCHDGGGGTTDALMGGASPMATLAWAGGVEHPDGHGGVPCVAILTGLALLALLVAAATMTGVPVLPADGAWSGLRLRPPAATLRPSLSRLCVLRI